VIGEEFVPDGLGLEPGKKASQFDYGGFLGRRTNAGSYTPLFWKWGRVLPLVENALVCHLISVGRSQPRQAGWIPCGGAFLANVGLPEEDQSKVIRSLRAKKLLEEKEIGGRRHLRIDLVELERILVKNAM
jgi:hypothetical protein